MTMPDGTVINPHPDAPTKTNKPEKKEVKKEEKKEVKKEEKKEEKKIPSSKLPKIPSKVKAVIEKVKQKV